MNDMPPTHARAFGSLAPRYATFSSREHAAPVAGGDRASMRSDRASVSVVMRDMAQSFALKNAEEKASAGWRSAKGTPLPYATDLYLDRNLLAADHRTGAYLPDDQLGATKKRLRSDSADIVPLHRSGSPEAEALLRYGDFAGNPDDAIHRQVAAKIGDRDPQEHLQIRHAANDPSFRLTVEIAHRIARVNAFGAPRKVALVSSYLEGRERAYAIPEELDEAFHGRPTTEASPIRRRPNVGEPPTSPETPEAAPRRPVAVPYSPDMHYSRPVKRKLAFAP